MSRYEELVNLSESLARLVTSDSANAARVIAQLDALQPREAVAVVAMLAEVAVGDASFEQSPEKRSNAVDVRWARFKGQLLERALLVPVAVDAAIKEFGDASFGYGEDDGSHEECVKAEQKLRQDIAEALESARKGGR